jgi:hypothetical protein
MVWEAKHGRCMLHVDAQGTVYTYRPGPWERHLCALVEGLGRSAQPITFLVDAQRLQAAATWLAQYGAPYNPLEELGHLALRAAQGASREEQPCTT